MTSVLEQLKTLPPETTLSIAHVLAIVEALKPGSTDDQNYSQWDPEKVITPEALAKWIGESTATLEKWRARTGAGPEFTKLSKSVRYQVGHVRDWLKSRTVTSTSDASVKGLARLEQLTEAFPVFVYPDGLQLHLTASIAHDEKMETEPSSFAIVRMTQNDLFELDGALLTDLTKAQSLWADGNNFSMPAWLYTQALSAENQNYQPYLQAITLLRKNGVDINAADPSSGMTLAHVLARTQRSFDRYTEFLGILLDDGLDVNREDRDGWSALVLAELDEIVDEDANLFLMTVRRRLFALSLGDMIPEKPQVPGTKT